MCATQRQRRNAFFPFQKGGKGGDVRAVPSLFFAPRRSSVQESEHPSSVGPKVAVVAEAVLALLSTSYPAAENPEKIVPTHQEKKEETKA